jgi:hypothetical protein
MLDLAKSMSPYEMEYTLNKGTLNQTFRQISTCITGRT